MRRALLLLVLCTGLVFADPHWTLYVNNQRFDATMGGQDTMRVDVRAFTHALGLPLAKNEAGQVTVDGQVLDGVTTTDGTDYAPLKNLVAVAGLRMETHPDLQMIDIRPKAVAMSAEELRRQMLHAYTVSTWPQMDYLYKLVRETLEQRLGLKLDHPVVTHWVTLADIRGMAGADGYGYSTAHVRGMDVASLDLYVPFGLSPSLTLHSMAHELGHCWQYDHGIFSAEPLKMEGFAEWVASKVLESLTMSGELQVMKANVYAQYRDGLVYFQNIDRSGGTSAVLQEMLKSRK
jgi:hypothetical protein